MPETTPLARGALAAPPLRAPRWRRGGWPWWLALLMWLLLFVREIPGLVQGIMDDQNLLSIGAVTLLGVALLGVMAVGVAALAPGRLTAQHLGLERTTLVRVAVWSVAALVALYGVVWLGTTLAGTPSQDTNFGVGTNLASDVMLVLGIAAVGPVAEELAYRATLFRALTDGLGRRLPPTVAAALGVLVSSTVFMLAHTGAPPWHLAAYFAFGAVLAAGYWWTGSLYVALVPHLLNNAYAAVTLALAGQASPAVVAVAALAPVIGIGLAFALSRVLPKV